MTRYSVHRFRAAVLHMYLRIAILLSLPLAVLYFFLNATPARGMVLLAFAMFVLWVKWRTRHDSEESLRYVNWFVLAMLGVMLNGTYNSNMHLRQEVWMMIFPVVFAPIVAVRERLVWMVAGAVGIVAVMMLRPETPTAISTFIFIVAYLALSYVTLMLVRHNESNIERLAHMTTIDPLTGAYNRGHLNDVLASEFNRCKRNRQSMVIIMLDIDHFKMLNDDYGHLYGDGVLERVADALTHAAQRAGDYVFRYGGEEFCILSSGMSRTEAFRFADKLRLAVSALEVENRNSPLGHLTASAGVWCVADLNAITQSALLLNVDNALYRAKAAGRNVVVDFADFVVLDETRSEMAEKAAA